MATAGVAPRASSLFVAGHGTGNNENSRKAIEAQVAIIRDLGLYNDVHAVFMEEDPRIADCCRLAGTDNIVMVPFFISGHIPPLPSSQRCYALGQAIGDAVLACPAIDSALRAGSGGLSTPNLRLR